VHEPPRNVMRDPEDAPPVLGTWRRIYIFVLCYLAFIVAGLYVFTRVFSS